MQSSSIFCCSSNSVSQSFSTFKYHRFTLLSARFTDNDSCAVFPGSSKWRLTSFRLPPPSRCTLNSAAELVENKSSAPGFIETGYISGVHGLQGEVRVKPRTDFPDLRFSKPGLRWLRHRVSGTETLQEVELLGGRGHPGQNWILKFKEINSVEQAKKLVGSTLLVTDKDRPPLDEGEFYTRDLIGMEVILKESGEHVGVVINVYNSGASDLLCVRPHMSNGLVGQVRNLEVGEGIAGHLVWVPFVEAIVPEVDLNKREMLITPPKGLLELNIRTHEKSKKERRELEWKERKKFQRHLIAAKKKLCEMEQQHVFHGFRYGDKSQTSLLADQIVNVNSKLLHQALQNLENPVARQSMLQVLSAVPKSNIMKVSHNPASGRDEKLSDAYLKLQKEGTIMASNGKFAIFLVLNKKEESGQGFDSDCVKMLLEDSHRIIETKYRPSVPLVLICPTHSISTQQELFSIHDYFGFDPEKVWFLAEEKLPIVGSSLEGNQKHKILMRSPWEFHQSPVGSGGFITSPSSENLLDRLGEMGVEYIEVRSINQSNDHGRSLLGLVASCKADVGFQLCNDALLPEEYLDAVLSLRFVKRLRTQLNKLEFHAALRSNSYVQMVEKDWIDVTPTAPNSYEFHCSIYGCLHACPPNMVCLIDSSQ